MDFSEIIEGLNETSLEAPEIAAIVLAAVTVKTDDGDDFADCKKLQEVITALTGLKKTTLETYESHMADIKKVEDAKKDKIGRAYYDSLKLGDAFQFIDSLGAITTVVKADKHSNLKNVKTAACTLITDPLKRKHPKFKNIIVPKEFTDESSGE